MRRRFTELPPLLAVAVLLTGGLLLVSTPGAVAAPAPHAYWTSGLTTFALDHRYFDDTAHCRTWGATLQNLGSTEFVYQGWIASGGGMQVSLISGPSPGTTVPASGSRSFSFNVCAPATHSGGSSTVAVTFVTDATNPVATRSVSVSVLKPGVLHASGSFTPSSVTFAHPRGDTRNTEILQGSISLTNTGDASLHVNGLETTAATGVQLNLQGSGIGTIGAGETRTLTATLRITDAAAEGSAGAGITTTWSNSPYAGGIYAPTALHTNLFVHISHPVRLEFIAQAPAQLPASVDVPDGVLAVPFTIREHYNFKAIENIHVILTGTADFARLQNEPPTRLNAGQSQTNQLLVSFPLDQNPCLGRSYTWRLTVSGPHMADTNMPLSIEAIPVVKNLEAEAARLQRATESHPREDGAAVGADLLDLAARQAAPNLANHGSCDNAGLGFIVILVPMGNIFLESHKQLLEGTTSGELDPQKQAHLVRTVRDLTVSGLLLQNTLEQLVTPEGAEHGATQAKIALLVDDAYLAVFSRLEEVRQSGSLAILDEASLYGNMARILELNDRNDPRAATFRDQEARLLQDYQATFEAARETHHAATANHESSIRSVSDIGGRILLWNPFMVERFRTTSSAAVDLYAEAGATYREIGQAALAANMDQARLEIQAAQVEAERSWLIALVTYAALFLSILTGIFLEFRIYLKDVTHAAEGEILLNQSPRDPERSTNHPYTPPTGRTTT